MNILITSWFFASRSGAELHAFELGLALIKQGHRVGIYAIFPGRLADQARARGLEVSGDLNAFAFVPDIIHGHHQGALADAMLAFPSVPAIFVVHNATSPDDEPIILPRIRRYVAVDRRCLNRIAAHSEIPAALQSIRYNFVDVARFKPRAALPTAPRKALVFSNYANSKTHLPAIAAACDAAGLTLDVVGDGMGSGSDEPEKILSSYDIVFAKARCAIEAMAAGTAVILCDFSGLGEMVTPENYDDLRDWNFGAGRLTRPLDAGLIGKEIARFDAAKSMAVSARMRAEGDLEKAVLEWEQLYREILREGPQERWPDDRKIWRRIQRDWRSEKFLYAFIGFARQACDFPHGDKIYALGRAAFRAVRG